MAIWPLLCPEWLSLYLTLGVPSLYRFILKSSFLYELRSHGEFLPYSVEQSYARKPAENISELRFLPNKRMKQGFFSIFFRCRIISGKERGNHSNPWLFDHYASQIRTVLTSYFRLFSTVIMLELCQSLSSIYHVVLLWTSHFCLKLIVLIAGDPWILDTSRSNSSIYIAFGAVVAVQVFPSHPHFERACSARQPDMGLQSHFCATYHANSRSNCVRIGKVCRTRKYARRNPSRSK